MTDGYSQGRITGNDAANHLDGVDGNDRFNGAGGRHVIISDSGNDLLTGGSGSDAFIFNSYGSRDTAMNFAAGQVLQLDVGNSNDVSITTNASINGYKISFDDTDILLKNVGTNKTINGIAGGSFKDITMNSAGGAQDTVICTSMFQRDYIPADV